MAIIRSIHNEIESPLLLKLKEKDRERSERMIAAFNKLHQQKKAGKLKKQLCK